jgi:signal transduction histidine kinase/DNA-binding response OmpR family regulator
MNLSDRMRTLAQRLKEGLASILAAYHRRGLRTRFALLFYLITLTSVAVVGYFGYDSASTAYHGKARELVASYTAETAGKMDSLQQLAKNDLDFLSQSQALLRYLYWRDLRDQEKQAHWGALAADLMREFATTYSYSYKIRFLDTEGNELIAVKRDPRGGKVDILPPGALQNKKNADYFERGMKLARGEYYASALSPNTERGVVEKPLVPVVRLVAPVIGANDVRYGVLVISILADAYSDYVHLANAVDPNRRFYLVDGDGDYLYHPDQAKVFGKVLGHGGSFHADFPDLLDKVKDFETQQTRVVSGKVMSFRHIHPNAGRHENGFILVGVEEESAALADLRGFVWAFLGLVVAVAVIVMFAARHFIDGIMRPLESVTTQLQRLGRGETGWQEIEYRGEDEISHMVASCKTLMLNMERLAGQADVISRGDFSGTVPLLSERDRLGQAINNMTAMLRAARREEDRGNWLKDGVGQLNLALTGDLGAQQLADAAIGLAGRTLEAGRGVFYVYRKDQEALELLGSYMYSEREALGNRFRLGEGAVGQVARELKPIILHGPEAAAPVVTGTRSQAPGHTYTYPLVREGELLGVIEFAAFERYDDLKLEFIARAADVMASFLYIVEQREQIRELLGVAEAAARQAQEQSRQLQEANALMEEQQQQLQQQTEELQASNAQMEEQQQQLRQQSEELRQTNAHLEEQQRRMEQQAQELEVKNRDLNQSRDELDLRARELEQASRYKSEFLANMSHELRTPLNSIILLAKMLALNEDDHLSPDEVKRASIVHRAGEELLRLINDILDLSKIESGKMELHNQRIASADLAAEFQDLFAATAAEKGLEFRIEDGLAGEFVSDHGKLSQIVRNLLSNAFKFTKQGSVTLRLEDSGRADLPIAIAVIDTGIGIPADKQQLVFEAFHQVDGSISREYGGTGLGLTISRRFAELLGGVIELRSEPGAGSQFILRLPRERDGQAVAPVAATPAVRPDAARPAPIVAAPAPFQVHDDRTNLKSSDPVILVIDDDPGFGEALMVLNRRLGYKTLVAATGQEGLRMARTYRPRGILLDLGLPDLDGAEVLHRLKSDRELRQLPVYIVSARDKGAADLAEGVAGYLQKPVSESQLADAEAAVLARAVERANGLLLLEGPNLDRAKLAGMARQDGLAITAVADLAGALAALAAEPWRLAVVDLARPEGGPALCRALREAAPDLQLILYSEAPLGAEEEAALRPYTDSIIVKTAHADARMLENIERFLRAMPAAGALPLPGAAGNGGKRLEGRRILVVDDDPRNLFVITAALEQQGAVVVNALSGRKGLEQLAMKPVDLVFMDIMMPDMDGYEAIRAIRAEPALKAIPVVALTAKALKADREKALQAGADDYLSKPVDYEVLINMARVWCEEKR